MRRPNLTPSRLLSATALLGTLLGVPASAQSLDGRRVYATREELQETLAQLELVVASPGYSQRVRQAKTLEAEALRTRLRDGDFQVGDRIVISVLNEAQFTDTFTVATGRMLVLPGISPIALAGVLRSESEAYLTSRLGQALRDPTVQVTPMVRLSILGQVGTPGFYYLPANLPLSDAIMQAGGPMGGSDPNRSSIRRSGLEIVAKEQFRDALANGMTLDQLSLRAGDELVVDYVRQGRFTTRNVVAFIGLLTSITYLITRF